MDAKNKQRMAQLLHAQVQMLQSQIEALLRQQAQQAQDAALRKQAASQGSNAAVAKTSTAPGRIDFYA